MEKIGVAAVVEGLSSFSGDMGKMDSLIKGLIPGSNMLSGAFNSLWGVLSNVASFVTNVLAHALGELLADAVQWVTQQIGDLIESAIDLGNQFQALEIRLNQLNFNDLTDEQKKLGDAMDIASGQTQEQIKWMQILATQTPFELADVAQVYGMARAFGYNSDEAKDLTETLSDFVFGMGLTGDAAVSITRQFGQMDNIGKVLQKDLNALAEGGMVPVGKILDIVKEKTGLSGKAFEDFMHSAGGVVEFKKAFSAYVEENYAGAAEKANRSFKNATVTLKEFFSSFAASTVVKNILDILGEKIASFNDAMSARLPDILKNFDRIGKAVGEILTAVLGLTPSATDMADGFVGALDSVATWLETHKGDIVAFFQAGYDFVNNTLIPKIQELKTFLFGVTGSETSTKTVTNAAGNERDITTGTNTDAQEGFFDKMLKTFREMQPLVQPIKELFSAIGEVAGVIGTMFGGKGAAEQKTFAESILSIADGISKLADFVSENKGVIAIFLISLAATIGFVIIAVTALSIVVSALTALFSFGVSVAIAIVMGILGGLIAILAAVVVGWLYLRAKVTEVLTMLLSVVVFYWNKMIDRVSTAASQLWEIIKFYTKKWYDQFIVWKDDTIASIVEWKNGMVSRFQEFVTGATQKITDLKNKVLAKFAELKSGVVAKLNEIKASIADILNRAVASIGNFDLWDVGWNMMKGMASGIASGAGLIYDAVINAVTKAYEAITGFLESKSPSRLMMEVGMNIDKGLAQGIENFSGMVSDSMKTMAQNMMAPVSVLPAMASSAAMQTVTNNNNNYNLNINTSARSEPIIADFQMMQSLSS